MLRLSHENKKEHIDDCIVKVTLSKPNKCYDAVLSAG